jgi:chromosome partitioning protein
MIIFTIGNRKGGVGKSTFALNFAMFIAQLGFKVLIIDLDDQQNATKSISNIVKSEKTIEDFLLNENIALCDVAIETLWLNVFILPSSSNLSGVTRALDSELGGHIVLKERLTKYKDMFDYVVIDTSPSLNILTTNALCASDYLLIPLNSKFFSLQGLQKTMTAFNKVIERLNPTLKLLGIAVVCHDKRNVLAHEVIDQIRSAYPEYLLNSFVGINIKIEEAQVKKESILTYDPADKGSIQYRELGNEILSRIKK